MDQEFRSALRLLQRAGGKFEQLNLHELLDHEGLATLAHHCVVARLRLLGVTLSVFPASIAYKTTMCKYGHLLHITTNVDQPRIFYTTRRWIHTHYTQGSQLPLGEHPLENLPHQITQELANDWQTVVGREPRPFRGPQHADASYQGTGIIALALDALDPARRVSMESQRHQAFYLVNIWKETSQSHYHFQQKKLREKGRLRGRNS